MSELIIRVPASSANMGPGFDTLAVAVSLYNTFHLTVGGDSIHLDSSSDMPEGMASISQSMVEAAAEHFFTRSSLRRTGFHIRMQSDIPIARGLASSATLRLAVMAGLAYQSGKDISGHDLAAWASELEGCTDNAAACYFGGMTASGLIRNRLYCYKTEIPDDIHFVAVSPVGVVETDKARTVFQETIPRRDAIETLNHAVLLSQAFARREFDAIAPLFEDWLHQPQREKAIPALHPLSRVIQAALDHGAMGAYLSGSGSTMMAIAREKPEPIAAAMKHVIEEAGMQAESRILRADNRGLVINP